MLWLSIFLSIFYVKINEKLLSAYVPNILFAMYLALQKWFISKFYIYFNIKIDRKIGNYSKSKNQRLIILIMKFEGYNSQYS